MTEVQVKDLLVGVGALTLDSHLVLTSGRHANAYMNKDAIYPHIEKISRLCFATALKARALDPEVVLGPALGGIVLSQWVAHHLSMILDRPVLPVYAEKSDTPEGFELRRGYDKFVRGRRVLVVEDTTTTGGSIRKVVHVARAAGGEIVGVSLLCNRGTVTPAEMGNVPALVSLISIDMPSWAEEDCPLCKDNVPVNTEVGKGKEFLRKMQSTLATPQPGYFEVLESFLD